MQGSADAQMVGPREQNEEVEDDNDLGDFDDLSDEKDDPEENREEIDKNKQRAQDDALFNIQGVGAIKNINGYDVYVKNKDCETSLNYLYRSSKNESVFDPWVKQILG